MPAPPKSPRLRRILVAYTVNRLGSWIGVVALSLAVYDHTHSALAVSGLLLAWLAFPAFLVPVLVARVESSPRRHELSGLYFFEGVATAAIVALLGSFWLPAILLLALLDGTAALAASALLRAEVARAGRESVAEVASGAVGGDAERELFEEGERRANASLNVAFSIAFVGGPVIGGLLSASAGASAALLIDMGSFLICGALLMDLHPHVQEAQESTVRARLRVAWEHINEAPGLRVLMLIEAAGLVFAQAAQPIEVSYAKSTLHAGDSGYGVLVTAWGAGAVLGSFVFKRLARRPLGLLLSGGTCALGAAFVFYAVAPTLALACLAAGIGGVGNTVEWPSFTSLVQRLTPPRLHGQLMGAVESEAALTMAPGLLLGGALVALSSTRTAFLLIGLGALAATAGFLRLTFGVLALRAPAGVGASEAQAASVPAGASVPGEPASD